MDKFSVKSKKNEMRREVPIPVGFSLYTGHAVLQQASRQSQFQAFGVLKANLENLVTWIDNPHTGRGKVVDL